MPAAAKAEVTFLQKVVGAAKEHTVKLKLGGNVVAFFTGASAQIYLSRQHVCHNTPFLSTAVWVFRTQGFWFKPSDLPDAPQVQIVLLKR
jgi:hypothetical protein